MVDNGALIGSNRSMVKIMVIVVMRPVATPKPIAATDPEETDIAPMTLITAAMAMNAATASHLRRKRIFSSPRFVKTRAGIKTAT